MWMVIGAVALFILYFVIKKKSNQNNTDETTLAQTSTSLEKTEKDDVQNASSPESTPVAEAPAAEVKEEVAQESKAAEQEEKPAKKAAPKKAPAKKTAAKKAEAAPKKAESTDAADNSDYSNQHSTLGGKFKQSKEFTLFDTKAAFFWNAGDNTVTLLSMTAFVKGVAKNTAYASYSFNVTDWTWVDDQPKGCATEIKKHLSENFKKGETA